MIFEQLLEKRKAQRPTGGISISTRRKADKDKLKQCPRCKKNTLEVVLNFDARGPPKLWKEKLKNIKQTKTVS